MACEFVCMRLDKTHLPEAKRDSSHLRQGDPLDVWPLGHHAPGALAADKAFFLVRVKGPLTPEQAAPYMQQELETVDGVDAVVRQRKYTVRLLDLSQAEQDSIRDTGEITINWSRLKKFVRNKLTGMDEG